jgi:hypothetical protein
VVTDIPTFRLLTGGAAGALSPTGDAAVFASALADVGESDLQIDRATRSGRVCTDLRGTRARAGVNLAYSDPSTNGVQHPRRRRRSEPGPADE